MFIGRFLMRLLLIPLGGCVAICVGMLFVMVAHWNRVAAMTARQVILQRLRDAAHDQTFGEYSGREGDTVTGVVQADAGLHGAAHTRRLVAGESRTRIEPRGTVEQRARSRQGRPEGRDDETWASPVLLMQNV